MNISAKLKNIFTTRLIIGLILGGTAGFLYYYYVGCASGSCAITSNPYITIAYGALFGAVLSFRDTKKKAKDHSEEQ